MTTLLVYHLCPAPVSRLLWHYALDEASPLQQPSEQAQYAQGDLCNSLQEGKTAPRAVRG